MNLTPHFTLDELIHSDKATELGIDNTPSKEIIQKLQKTAEGLERVRSVLQRPMHSSSGYRCYRLNKALGGADDSQHMRGEADDFTSPDFGSPLEVCRAILDHADFVDFDQMIYEGTWVHISFSNNPRREILTAKANGKKKAYVKGLP